MSSAVSVTVRGPDLNLRATFILATWCQSKSTKAEKTTIQQDPVCCIACLMFQQIIINLHNQQAGGGRRYTTKQEAKQTTYTWGALESPSSRKSSHQKVFFVCTKPLTLHVVVVSVSELKLFLEHFQSPCLSLCDGACSLELTCRHVLLTALPLAKSWSCTAELGRSTAKAQIHLNCWPKLTKLK